MHMLKNKTTAIAFALILLFAFSGLMIAMPTSKAQTAASPIPTNAYLVASPNPAGVGQQVSLEFWLVQQDPISAFYVGGHWANFTVLVTKPDGTTQTLGPFTAGDSGAAQASFTPTTVGNYTLKFTFLGQHVVGLSPFGVAINAYYGASSYTITLTVQQQPVLPTPQVPLPTTYWQNPVNSQDQLWSSISGNWFGTPGSQGGPLNTFYNDSGNFNPYTTAPNTAHIVWTKPLMFGGLIGGEFGGTSTSNYYTGKSYQQPFAPPVIINGVLYYNTPLTLNLPYQGFYAVDLRTGQTLWYQNNTFGITNGQVVNFLSPNQEGGLPYVWYMAGTTYYMYDANTGNLVAQVTNAVPVGFNGAGNCIEGPNGELLVYVLGNNWLAMWNSTLCLLPPTAIFTNYWTWRPSGTYDFSKGVQWNVTETTYPGESIWEINEGVILATTMAMISPQNWQMEVGYSATTGAQLWAQNRTTPLGNTAYGLMGTIGDGVYTEFDKATMQWYGYSIYTGKQVWGPSTAYTNPWGSIPNNSGLFAQVAYGTLYAQSVDGIHALNMTTGQTLWTFYGFNSGANFPGFNTYPFETNGLYTVAGGEVIASTGDSHGVPQFRGANLYAINAYTGQLVWSINGYFQCIMPVADGYLVAFNNYDNQIYCFGKGTTDTIVQTPLAGATQGQSFTIQGTVMDTSAGASQTAVKANFPNGLPCVSDASMTQFMEAVYMQQPMPTNVTGVPVTITAIDPNGNYIILGNTTSDANGYYSLKVNTNTLAAGPGEYKVTATFAGSNSYYASSAESSFTLNAAAPTPAPTAAPVTGLASTGTVELGVAAIVIVIVIIGAAIMLMLRKRP
jgi:hypothetical protein